MTGMEHVIKRAVDVLNLAGAHCGECGREPGESLSECPSCELHIGDCAAYLAEAGLIAPAPLTEIRAENQFGETHRRWATDWEPVHRAENDGRADRPSWVDEHGINHADGDGGRW